MVVVMMVVLMSIALFEQRDERGSRGADWRRRAADPPQASRWWSICIREPVAPPHLEDDGHGAGHHSDGAGTASSSRGLPCCTRSRLSWLIRQSLVVLGIPKQRQERRKRGWKEESHRGCAPRCATETLKTPSAGCARQRTGHARWDKASSTYLASTMDEKPATPARTELVRRASG